MKKVFISLISFNNHDVTRTCLKSLDRAYKNDVRVLIIDNGSKENFSLDGFTLKHLRYEIIRSEVNKGFSGGHNIAFKHALKKNADYVIVLNNDTEVAPDMVDTLIVIAEKNEKVGILSPKVYFSKGSEFHKDRYKEKELGKVIWYAGGIMDWSNIIGKHTGVDEVDTGQFEGTKQTEFATGCCMVIKRSVLEKIGMFDEKYFLYYEDVDFNLRARKAGFEILFTGETVLWHNNAGSTGGSGSELQDYFISRNRLRFGFRYASPRTKAALVRESIRLLNKGRKWQKNGVKDFYLGRFGKGSYPV